MYYNLLSVTLVNIAYARFNQQNPPVEQQAGAAVGGAIGGLIPGSLLGAADPCAKLSLADTIANAKPGDPAALAAAKELVHTESNFNNFAQSGPKFCLDATLPKTKELRGILPRISDDGVTPPFGKNGGKTAAEANAIADASLITPLQADGMSVGALYLSQGFKDAVNSPVSSPANPASSANTATPATPATPASNCNAKVLEVIVQGKETRFGFDGRQVALNPAIPIQNICQQVASSCTTACNNAGNAVSASKLKGISGDITPEQLIALGKVADEFNSALGNTSNFAASLGATATATASQDCNAPKLEVISVGREHRFGLDGQQVALNPSIPAQRVCDGRVPDSCKAKCRAAQAIVGSSGVKGVAGDITPAQLQAMQGVADAFNSALAPSNGSSTSAPSPPNTGNAATTPISTPSATPDANSNSNSSSSTAGTSAAIPAFVPGLPDCPIAPAGSISPPVATSGLAIVDSSIPAAPVPAPTNDAVVVDSSIPAASVPAPTNDAVVVDSSIPAASVPAPSNAAVVVGSSIPAASGPAPVDNLAANASGQSTDSSQTIGGVGPEATGSAIAGADNSLAGSPGQTPVDNSQQTGSAGSSIAQGPAGQGSAGQGSPPQMLQATADGKCFCFV